MAVVDLEGNGQLVIHGDDVEYVPGGTMGADFLGETQAFKLLASNSYGFAYLYNKHIFAYVTQPGCITWKIFRKVACAEYYDPDIANPQAYKYIGYSTRGRKLCVTHWCDTGVTPPMEVQWVQPGSSSFRMTREQCLIMFGAQCPSSS